MATRPLRVHVVADSDSRWKWGAALARRLDPNGGVRPRATLLHGPSAPTLRQLRELGERIDVFDRATVADFVASHEPDGADVIVLACVGGTVQALLHRLAHAWSGSPRRPAVVTGYVGLVYERHVDGALLRAGADVVLANSANDEALFREIFQAVDVDPDTVVRTALPFLGGAAHDPTAAGRTRPFTVAFVTQPGVPESRAERKYALLQAVEHAIRHPERHVVVKLRARLRERTTHAEPYHYTSLLPTRQLPANVELCYGSMADLLDRTDLCVTVSSTAALEAMHRDIPTAVITDFGIRESLGNHVFLGSGALTSWSALHAGEIPKADADWAARNGVRDDDAYAAAARRVLELTAPGHVLPALRPWMNVTDEAGYLPRLLQRHGLDRSGAPLPVASGRRRDGMPARTARTIARRFYDFGVRTVEPRLKRMAER